MLVAVPDGVTTVIGAVAAPAGTMATISVLELTVKAAAFTVPNCTAVTLLNLVPEIVTLVPAGPLEGAKAVIVGGLLTAFGSYIHAPRPWVKAKTLPVPGWTFKSNTATFGIPVSGPW